MDLKGVKKHTRSPETFASHMKSFIPHITNQSHMHCLHPPSKVTKHANPITDKDALDALATLINSYLADCKHYLHSFSTIQLESLNGSAAKRVSKEQEWTVMYCCLFDAGILERNEGTPTLVDYW